MKDEKLMELEEKIISLYQGEKIEDIMIDEFCDEICSFITKSKFYKKMDNKGIARQATYSYDDQYEIIKHILIGNQIVGEIIFYVQDYDKNKGKSIPVKCETIELFNIENKNV